MRQRVVQSVLIVLAAIVLLGILWTTSREHKLVTAFRNMPVGTTEIETKSQLGAPWQSGPCGQVFGGSAPSGCKEEYIYASPYARFIPRYWAFRFDDRGRLIDKYEYQSP